MVKRNPIMSGASVSLLILSVIRLTAASSLAWSLTSNPAFSMKGLTLLARSATVRLRMYAVEPVQLLDVEYGI